MPRQTEIGSQTIQSGESSRRDLLPWGLRMGGAMEKGIAE